MQYVEAKTARASLCECGFSILRDEIPLGTVYRIAPETRRPGTLVCGGCGQRIRVTLVHALATGRHAGWLPYEIFEARS